MVIGRVDTHLLCTCRDIPTLTTKKSHFRKLTPLAQVPFLLLVQYTPSSGIPESLYDLAIKDLIPGLIDLQYPTPGLWPAKVYPDLLMPFKYF